MYSEIVQALLISDVSFRALLALGSQNMLNTVKLKRMFVCEVSGT